MPESADEIIEKKLYEWRRLYGVGPFPVGDLREACGLKKSEFDAAIWRLAARDQVRLVKNPRGEYQWVCPAGRVTTRWREWRLFRPGGRTNLSMR